MSKRLKQVRCLECDILISERDSIIVNDKIYCSLICGDVMKCKVCEKIKPNKYKIHYCSKECELEGKKIESLQELPKEVIEVVKEETDFEEETLDNRNIKEDNLNKKIIEEEKINIVYEYKDKGNNKEEATIKTNKKSINLYALLKNEDNKYFVKTPLKSKVLKKRFILVNREVYEYYGFNYDVKRDLWYKNLGDLKLIISYSMCVLVKGDKYKEIYNLNKNEISLKQINEEIKKRKLNSLSLFMYIYDLRRSINKLNEKVIKN